VNNIEKCSVRELSAVETVASIEGVCMTADTPTAISGRTRWLWALIGASWLCLAAIAYLSLVPRSMEVRTSDLIGLGRTPSIKAIRGLFKAIEHVLAYSVTAALLIKAYPARPVWLIIAFLSTYSAVLEALQTFSPGRHPGIAGVIWSSLGAVAAGWVTSRMRLDTEADGTADRL
jgi:VanZ family protein